MTHLNAMLATVLMRGALAIFVTGSVFAFTDLTTALVLAPLAVSLAILGLVPMATFEGAGERAEERPKRMRPMQRTVESPAHP